MEREIESVLGKGGAVDPDDHAAGVRAWLDGWFLIADHDHRAGRRGFGCAFAFLFKPFHGIDVDRELHRLFDLKMPLLTTAAEPVA